MPARIAWLDAYHARVRAHARRRWSMTRRGAWLAAATRPLGQG